MICLHDMTFSVPLYGIGRGDAAVVRKELSDVLKHEIFQSGSVLRSTFFTILSLLLAVLLIFQILLYGNAYRGLRDSVRESGEAFLTLAAKLADESFGRLCDAAQFRSIIRTISPYVLCQLLCELVDGAELDGTAAQLGISPSYLSRIFSEVDGKRFTLYLSDLRIEQAKRLLADESKLVRDVGQEVGFLTVQNFMWVFKSKTGVTPSEYRSTLPRKS